MTCLTKKIEIMRRVKKCLIKIRKGWREGNNNFRENWKEEGIMGLIMPIVQNWIITLTAVLYARMIIEFFRATMYELPLG